MKIFAWVYLIAFSLDAGISIVASFDSSLETLSNIVSAPIILFTLIAFILSCINRLKPRKLFVTLSGFYLGMVIFGIVLGVLLAAKLGPESMPSENLQQFLRNQFAWYWTVHWCLMLLWLFLATYGFITLKKENRMPNQALDSSAG